MLSLHLSYFTHNDSLKRPSVFHCCLSSHVVFKWGYFQSLITCLPFLLSPPPAGCATSFQVTVVTSTSWSAIVTAASTNITESGAPMLNPSRCSRCVESSNETCSLLSQPLTLYLLQLPPPPPPLPLPPPPFTQSFQALASSVRPLRLTLCWCFTNKMFTALLFCSVAKWK